MSNIKKYYQIKHDLDFCESRLKLNRDLNKASEEYSKDSEELRILLEVII